MPFRQFLRLWIHEKIKFRASKCVRMADLALLELSKLISRKIWVIEKSWNFNTVKQCCQFWLHRIGIDKLLIELATLTWQWALHRPGSSITYLLTFLLLFLFFVYLLTSQNMEIWYWFGNFIAVIGILIFQIIFHNLVLGLGLGEHYDWIMSIFFLP